MTWRGGGGASAVLAALAGCQWFSTAPDRPELMLDEPAAVSPGKEYHLRGTALTVTNVDVTSGPAVAFHVASGDSAGLVNLEPRNDRGAFGGYNFVLQAIEEDKQRAVIVIHHTRR